MGTTGTSTTTAPTAPPTGTLGHVTRTYHAFPGAQYALPSDDLELQRHHDCLKRLFKNKLVWAPVDLDNNDKVLDSGAGTGCWVLDVAASVARSVSFVGIDIATRLFPTNAPKNTEFRQESVVRLPDDWNDTFSLVNQRFLMMGLRTSEWPIAMREIYRVLRPGGWVQLGEGYLYIEGENPDKPCMEKLVSITRRMVESRDLFIDCARSMPQMLEEAGFVDIQCASEVQCMGSWGGDLGVTFREIHTDIWRGLKQPVLKADGFGIVASGEEYDALVDGVIKEWEEIPGTGTPHIVHWARKPAGAVI
ncbi:S-adenosyl-L-methionine-dependent methyltransferase [Mycena pura]|uniref:S-adenosyl-L-methionine-dependent methyltransferase n=1 Tax=Mycena pura TaxID=153505 RepID=A0AAD6YLN0_9AGAR|nr:S-adenosyl-L-methionine-dependent methyltransferase [Mycena pura]